MAQLKSSEKRMLVILLGGLFLLGNVLGWAWYSSVTLRAERRLGTLKTKVSALEMWKRESAAAATKREWIDEHLKAYADETARDTYLDSIVQGELRNGLDLELLAPRPLDPVMPTDSMPFIRSRYEAKVKGTWADVMEFIYRLQRPTEFRFVPVIRMVPRKNEANDAEQFVECTFTIEKWWHPDSGSGLESAANEQAPVAAVESSEPPAVAGAAALVPATAPASDEK